MTDYEKYIDDMIAADFSKLDMIEMCMNEFSVAYPSFEYTDWRKIITERIGGGVITPSDINQETTNDFTPINIVDKYNKAITKGQYLLKWDKGNGPIEKWKINYYDAWDRKYKDLKDRVKNINSDYSSGMIDEDVYRSICEIEKQLDEWYERRQKVRMKNKIERNLSSPTEKPQTSSSFAENHGASWSEHDDKQVVFLYKSGDEIKMIAEKLGRSEKAIYCRLETLQTIRPEQNPYNPSMKPSISASSRITTPFDKYAYMLTHMNRSSRNGCKAPHKVILMLAVMSLYKNQQQRHSNDVKITSELSNAFNKYWKKYVLSDVWSMDLLMPWNHMEYEPFWQSKDLDDCICASIDDDLRRLFIDTSSMVKLRELLIDSL